MVSLNYEDLTLFYRHRETVNWEINPGKSRSLSVNLPSKDRKDTGVVQEARVSLIPAASVNYASYTEGGKLLDTFAGSVSGGISVGGAGTSFSIPNDERGTTVSADVTSGIPSFGNSVTISVSCNSVDGTDSNMAVTDVEIAIFKGVRDY